MNEYRKIMSNGMLSDWTGVLQVVILWLHFECSTGQLLLHVPE